MMENGKKLEFPEGQERVKGEPGVPSKHKGTVLYILL
jgi:hypothetical protein